CRAWYNTQFVTDPQPSEATMSAEDNTLYDDAADQAVRLGNQMAESHPDADVWDIADGILAGAVHYWLFASKPCGDPQCEDCAPLSTPEGRIAEMKRLVEKFAQDSDYYHTPEDLLS